MSEADHAAAADAYGPDLVPLPVRVGHDVDVHGQAADYGGWSTFTTPAGADRARMILPFEPARHRAVMSVSIPVAAAGAGVWVGTPAQTQAAPPVGGFLAAGGPPVVIENNQQLWLIGDGTNACIVTVLQERWDSRD
jgi:hypothetical protein